MASTNLEPEKILELATKLENWTQLLEDSNNKAYRLAQDIDSWRDPQHRIFLDAVNDSRKEISLCTNKLHEMVQFLRRYAEQTEENRLNFVKKIIGNNICL